jgi:amino acid permease
MSRPAPRFDAIIEREKGLHRGLSSGQLSMIAIGGAIGTGLLLGSGTAITFAGPGVVLSYAVGALIAFLLMGCLAEMTVAHPTSGSFGAWAEFYVSPLAELRVLVVHCICGGYRGLCNRRVHEILVPACTWMALDLGLFGHSDSDQCC